MEFGDIRHSRNTQGNSRDGWFWNVSKTVLVDVIKKLFKENGIKTKKVVTSLSGDSVIIRYVKLPFMTAEELSGAIPREAEQYIPLNLDQVVLDFQILGEIQEDGQRKLDVLLCG